MHIVSLAQTMIPRALLKLPPQHNRIILLLQRIPIAFPPFRQTLQLPQQLSLSQQANIRLPKLESQALQARRQSQDIQNRGQRDGAGRLVLCQRRAGS